MDLFNKTMNTSAPGTVLPPRLRDGIFLDGEPSPAPYTTPSMTANLVLRVTLALISIAVCIVPLRVLRRNGEFAAAVFIVTVQVLNLETVVNSLLWPNEDFESWWPGYGFCDVENPLHNSFYGLFITCLWAIMRNLAQQVGMMRANPLTGNEKRRRNLIQALIMFPLPIVQLAWTFPAAAQRYEIDPLIGCSWVPHLSWPNLVFFILPPVIIALITSGYAVLTYIRFRQVAKTTESALSNSGRANRRSQRTKRRLYMMVISILIPYLPLVILLAVGNVLQKPAREPFDYDAIHNHPHPLPWSTILYAPASVIFWGMMNNCYMNVFAAIPIFIFFGTTKDAINQYRLGCLFLGLGRFFPRLKEEYDPDSGPATTGSSFGSGQTATVFGFVVPRRFHFPSTSVDSLTRHCSSPTSMAKTKSSISSSHHFASTHSTTTSESREPRVRAIDFAAPPDLEGGLCDSLQPWPASHDQSHNHVSPDPARPLNPFPFRTRFNMPVPFRLPFNSRDTEPRQTQQRPVVTGNGTTPASGPLPPWDNVAGPEALDLAPFWSIEEVSSSGVAPDNKLPCSDGSV
ncbi:hypothetical protein HIM_06521 [Hirsutella minnesotensis 3608]|uniref:Pheromone a factor receptor n=1 Tax=Hirsutella minnesotensis 3608 TaxID=1043627 RepID=A0A0F7ZZE3_9HYPO|nr:hypothetical protein HIM_06521 [Hirsutella minnesotensis 3608]